MQIVKDLNSTFNWVSEEVATALKVDTQPLLETLQVATTEGEITASTETILYFRKAWGELTQQAHFCITPSDRLFKISLGSKDSEKFDKILSHWLDQRRGPESKPVVIGNKTSLGIGSQLPLEKTASFVTNIPSGSVAQDEEVPAMNAEGQAKSPQGN
jgi:hypothetical protein